MKVARFIQKAPAIAALFGGCLAALALPPLHIWPGVLGFALLLRSLDDVQSKRRAFLTGWSFGFGFHLLGLYWIAVAFYSDAERFGALAVPAILLLAAGLALVQGLIGVAWCGLTSRSAPLLAKALILAGLWMAGELIRGDNGLQFPWNPIVSALGSSDALMQPIAWIGPHLMGLIVIVSGGLFASFLDREWVGKWRLPAAGLAILAGLWGLGTLRLSVVEPEQPSGQNMRIVQANIAQYHKWDEDRISDWFFRHIEMSAGGIDSGIDVLVWPESAIPYRVEEETTRQAIFQRLGRGIPILAGSNHFMRSDAGTELHNSLYALSADGEISARYDKVDLVPFGEFLPARDLMTALGLEKLTPGSIDFMSGEGRRTIEVDGIPSFSPLICYEAIFAGNASDIGDRPYWLLNVTNDAWFGHSSGPYQHLVMARMRAVEEGLPLIRAANTGISVVTDAFGRVLERLDLGQQGVIDAALPGRLAEPPLYKRFTHVVSLSGLALCFVIAWMLIWMHRQSPNRPGSPEQ